MKALDPVAAAAAAAKAEEAAAARRVEEEWGRTLLGRLGGRPSAAWVAQHHRIQAAKRGR